MAPRRINEKRIPHYNLTELKKLLLKDKTRNITRSSISGAHSIGFSKTQMIDTVQLLRRENFYKSMTIYGNHKIWQDVDYLKVEQLNLYIKLQTLDKKGVIISFKNTGD